VFSVAAQTKSGQADSLPNTSLYVIKSAAPGNHHFWTILGLSGMQRKGLVWKPCRQPHKKKERSWASAHRRKKWQLRLSFLGVFWAEYRLVEMLPVILPSDV